MQVTIPLNFKIPVGRRHRNLDTKSQILSNSCLVASPTYGLFETAVQLDIFYSFVMTPMAKIIWSLFIPIYLSWVVNQTLENSY